MNRAGPHRRTGTGLVIAVVTSFFLVACGDRASPPASKEESISSSKPEEAERSRSVIAGEAAAQPDSSDQTTVGDRRSDLKRLTLELTGRDIASGKTFLDSEGNPVAATFADGSKVIFEASRPVSFINGEGEKAVYEYDAQGNLLQIIAPHGDHVRPEVQGSVRRKD